MTASSSLAGARILVTGPSGFLGSHCLHRLLAETCEVHAVNRSGGAGPADGRIRWHMADLHDAERAAALMAEIKPSHFLHAAWIAIPGVYARSPENLRWLQASVALLRAFGEQGGIRFVGIGSSAEYQTADTPCKEDETPIRPESIYGACKAALWLAAQAAARHYGFSAGWGRVFLLYGRNDVPQRLIPSVLSGFAARQIVNTTHGRQVRDFIDASDAADLLVRLLNSDAPGAFNIGTGRGTPVRYAIDYLADRLAAKDLVRLGAIQPAATDPSFLVADMTKVRTRLGWTPATSFEAGLDALLATPGFGIASHAPSAGPDRKT